MFLYCPVWLKEYLYDICTIFAQYLNNICTIFAQYLHNICTIFAYYLHIIRQYSYNDPNKICTIFAQYCQNICTIQRAQYLSNICTIFPQYLCNICTIFDPIGMSQFMKFVGKTFCWKFVYLHINCTIYGNICIRVKAMRLILGLG